MREPCGQAVGSTRDGGRGQGMEAVPRLVEGDRPYDLAGGIPACQSGVGQVRARRDNSVDRHGVHGREGWGRISLIPSSLASCRLRRRQPSLPVCKTALPRGTAGGRLVSGSRPGKVRPTPQPWGLFNIVNSVRERVDPTPAPRTKRSPPTVHDCSAGGQRRRRRATVRRSIATR